MSGEKQDVLQSTNAFDDNIEKNDRQDPDQLLSYFPCLLDKSQNELKELERKVLHRLDWRFLPCVTMMLLMR